MLESFLYKSPQIPFESALNLPPLSIGAPSTFSKDITLRRFLRLLSGGMNLPRSSPLLSSPERPGEGVSQTSVRHPTPQVNKKADTITPARINENKICRYTERMRVIVNRQSLFGVTRLQQTTCWALWNTDEPFFLEGGEGGRFAP